MEKNIKRKCVCIHTHTYKGFVVVQLLTHVWFFLTPWTAACQAYLYIYICMLRCVMLIRLVVSDSSTPGTGAHQAPLSIEILQVRIREWVVMPCSRGSSQPRNWTDVSCIAGGFFTSWAPREAPWSQFSPVQSLSHVWLFPTPWTAAHQASLSITNSQSPPKPMSIVSVIPSNHLILCRPLLLLPSIFPNIRVFSNESALCIRWPKY